MYREALHLSEDPSAGFDERETPPLNFKRILRLQARVMILVALPVGAILATATLLFVPEEYTSSATFQILAVTPRVMESGRADPLYETFMNTQIGLVTGPAILGRVIDEPEIASLPAFENSSDPLDSLEKRVNSERVRRTELLALTCTMPEGHSAKVVLDAIVSEYLAYTHEQEVGAGGNRAAILRAELVPQGVELERSLAASTGLRGKLRKNLETEASDYHRRMLEVDEEVSNRENSVRNTSSKVSEIRELQTNHKASPKSVIFDYGVEEEVVDDARIIALESEVVAAGAKLQEYREILQSTSQRMVAEERKMASLMKSLITLKSAVRGERLSLVLARFENALRDEKVLLTQAEERLQKYVTFLADYDQQLKDEARLQADIQAEERNAAATRSLIDEIRRKISELELESQAQARVNLVAKPTLPEWPDSRRKLQLVALSLLASIALGFGVGAWREMTDQNVRSAEDLARITSVPVIASVPHVSMDQNLNPAQISLISSQYPNSILAEEYRRVAAQILQPNRAKASRIRTVLISSPTEGEGKTSLTCNLATTLALANRSVLLLDVNPPLSSETETSFGMGPHQGLGEYLNAGGDFADYIRPSPTKNLQIMSAGLESAGLTSMLASITMTELLKNLEETFDYVIIDSPPALLSSQVKLLAPHVDAVLMVVGVGGSTLGMVSRCLREIQCPEVNLMGIVLNGLRAIPGGYLQTHVEHYHDYFGTVGSGSSEGLVSETESEENILQSEPAQGASQDDDELQR